MTHKAMDVYLNDHLAGAMLGSDLAQQIQSRNQGTPLGELMQALAPQIEEDRQTLIGLMERMGTSKSPVKQAGAWVTEKASRVKFGGLISGEQGLGTFMAVESLALGVQGKLSLWRALEQVADQHPAIASINLRELIDRAQTQYNLLEAERLVAGTRALGHVHTASRGGGGGGAPRPRGGRAGGGCTVRVLGGGDFALGRLDHAGAILV
jgi:hypothetical protein